MGNPGADGEGQPRKPIRLAWKVGLLRLRRGLHSLALRLGRLRLLPLEPRSHGAVPALQVLIGRLLGRCLLLCDAARERWRIRRSHVSQGSVSSSRILFDILRQQYGRIFWLLVLFIGALLVDWASQTGKLGWLPPIAWLRGSFTLPSDNTLSNLLLGVSAGTGVILGLVLTVSMTVFQTTAARYESDRVVQFLLREPVGARVISLLSTGFILSLLTLGAINVASFSPALATYLTLVIAIGGVLSAIVYRQYALFGYLASSLFGSIAREVRRLTVTVSRVPGRNVEARAYAIAREDVLTCKELFQHLLRKENSDAVAAGLFALRDIVQTEMAVKSRIPEDSRWWERREAPLTGLDFGIGDNLARSSGLTTPIQQVAHIEWLEELALTVSKPVLDSPCLVSPAVIDALFQLYATLLVGAWANQEPKVLDLTLAQIGQLAVSSSDSVTDAVGRLAWVLTDSISRDPSLSPAELVAAKPWTKKGHLVMPLLLREEAKRIRTQIRREIDIAGAVVTPDVEMVREIEGRWNPEWARLRQAYLSSAFALLSARLATVADQSTSDASIVVEAWFGLQLKTLSHGLHPPVGAEVVHVIRVFEADTAERRSKHWRLLLLSIHAAAEANDAGLVSALVALLLSWFNFERDKRAPEALVTMMNDAIVTLSIAYAWSQLDEEPEFIQRFVGMTTNEFIDMMIRYVEVSLKSFPGRLRLAGMQYIQWTQPLNQRARQLPDEATDAFFETQKRHRSRLFRQWSFTSGADYWIEGFITDLGLTLYGARLVRVLKEVAQRRRGS